MAYRGVGAHTRDRLVIMSDVLITLKLLCNHLSPTAPRHVETCCITDEKHPASNSLQLSEELAHHVSVLMLLASPTLSSYPIDLADDRHGS